MARPIWNQNLAVLKALRGQGSFGGNEEEELEKKKILLQLQQAQRPSSRFNITPGGSGESNALTRTLQGIGNRMNPQVVQDKVIPSIINVKDSLESLGSKAQKTSIRSGQPLLDKIIGAGQDIVSRANIGLGEDKFPKVSFDPKMPGFAPTNTNINAVNSGIGMSNPRFRGPPGAPSAPVIPAGARARHHPGFDKYAYAGKPNRSSPFSSKLLADLRKTEEEDEFMSYDDQMFLLALMEGMQGGPAHVPVGRAFGGGTKDWATLPSMRMS